MKKKESLLFIEECFRNIQLEKNVDKNIRLIESTVKREYDIPIKINIIPNKQQFFGMCVYASEDEIMEIATLILNQGTTKDIERIYRENITRTTKTVEIDYILLYDHNLNMTSGEITAILLHELGHVVMSEAMVHRFKKMKLYFINHATSGFKRISDTWLVKSVMQLSVAQALSNQFNAEYVNEKNADNFAFKEGYGEELCDALNKFILNGKGSIIKKNEKEIEQELETTMDWAITNISQLQFRKDKLKKSLRILSLTTPSKFMSGLIDGIHEKFDKKSNPKFPDAMIEINEAFILSNMKKVKAPSGVMDRSGRVKKLDQRSLDIYRAELERVNTTDDKIFLLERLYDLLDHAEYALYMLQEDPKAVMQTEKSIRLYIDRVNDLIDLVNKKKISRTKYGLYIKYPSGYEG